MQVWHIRSDVKNFTSIYLIDDSGDRLNFYPELPDFEGQKLGEQWLPIKAKFYEHKPVGNFVDLDPGILICDSFALLKLKPYIINEVEIFPISVDGLEMNVLNITNVVECLDEGKSLIKYFDRIGGDVMDIHKYVFQSKILKNVMLFKIPQLSRTEIFGTDKFYSKVKEDNLTGLEFKLVYED